MSDSFTPGVGYSRSASLIESQITLSSFKSAFDFTLSDSSIHGKMTSRDLIRTPTADRNAQNYKFEYEDGRVILARAFQDYSLSAYDSQWNFTIKASEVKDITDYALGAAYSGLPSEGLKPGGSLRAFDLADKESVILQMDLQGRVFEKANPQRAMVPPDHTPTPGGIYNPVNIPLNTIPDYYQGGYTPSETPLSPNPIDVTSGGFEDSEQNLEPFCRVLPSILEIALETPPPSGNWWESLGTPTPFDWSTATRVESTLPPGEELFPTTPIDPEIQKAADEFFKPKDQPPAPSWVPGGNASIIDLSSMTPGAITPSDNTPQIPTPDPLLLSNDFWSRFEKPLNVFEVSPVIVAISTNPGEAIAN